MRKIPEQLRDELSQDKFYKECCISDNDCDGKIEWHHNLIFAGKQVNETFCILPVCQYHHEKEKHLIYKEKLNWVMWARATHEQILEYSKAIDYQEVFNRLEKRYGTNNNNG